MRLSHSDAFVMIVSTLAVVAMALSGGGFVGMAQGQADTGPADVDASDLSGSGTADNPYVIQNASELQAMEDDLDAHYELGGDIDAAATAQWDGGSGFDPVGPTESAKFTGSLDGNGHTIADLTIDRPDTRRVGLFGVLNESEVRDLTLTDATVTGLESTGSVAGELYGGTIEGVTASVTIEGSSEVGGIVGASVRPFPEVGPGTIADVTVSGTVDGNVTGGVAGRNTFDGTVRDADADATVTGAATNGGLVGSNSGTITDVTASGSVEGTGDQTGGLVGSNLSPSGEITNAVATGDVNGADSTGGLVGANTPQGATGAKGVIDNVSASGAVAGQNKTGGLVGTNKGVIRTATATGDVTGASRSGGLVGQNGGLFSGGEIQNAKATGAVTVDRQFAGGLVGVNPTAGTVRLSFATGAVTGTADAGGLVALNTLIEPDDSGTVTESYWDTETTGQPTSAGDAVGLTTADMTGPDALTNMTELSDGVWQPTETSYPVLQLQTSEDPPTESSDTLDVSVSDSTIPAGTPTDVTITVTDNQTGEPVPDATVTIQDLLKEDTTDTDGEVVFSITETEAAEYLVIVTADGYDEARATLTVADTGATPAPVVGDTPPQDLTGDGTFEDVDGDGELSILDVQALFANLDSDAVQNTPGAFDFNGDGSVSILDVQALFNQQAQSG